LRNIFLPWTIDELDKYEENLNWKYLSINKAVFQSVILPLISDKMIINLFERLKKNY
jgi:hypothetical protein